MRVVVVEPPLPFVTVEKAKSHLRVDGIDDDALIDGYIAAATGLIDGPAGWLGRAIGRQTLEAATRLTARRCVQLAYPPIVDLVSVNIRRGDASEPVDAASYALDGETLTFRNLSTVGCDSVVVRYRAGYEAVPPAIITAVLLMVGQLYANRDGGSPDFAAADALLSPYRVYR